jgi:hypothetical protein
MAHVIIRIVDVNGDKATIKLDEPDLQAIKEANRVDTTVQPVSDTKAIVVLVAID